MLVHPDCDLSQFKVTEGRPCEVSKGAEPLRLAKKIMKEKLHPLIPRSPNDKLKHKYIENTAELPVLVSTQKPFIQRSLLSPIRFTYDLSPILRRE